ncbi:unnamed protein product [Choristocarpus tenellus]
MRTDKVWVVIGMPRMKAPHHSSSSLIRSSSIGPDSSAQKSIQGDSNTLMKNSVVVTYLEIRGHETRMAQGTVAAITKDFGIFQITVL